MAQVRPVGMAVAIERVTTRPPSETGLAMVTMSAPSPARLTSSTVGADGLVAATIVTELLTMLAADEPAAFTAVTVNR